MRITEGFKIHTAIKSGHCAAVTGAYISLKNAHKAWAIIMVDESANNTRQDFHLYKATAVAGTGEVVDQTANWWRNDNTATGDTLTAQTAGATFQTAAGQTAQMIVVEIDPKLYPGYDCFAIHSDAGNIANWATVIYIVETRYAQCTPPTIITD
jgi:hypothetical protein